MRKGGINKDNIFVLFEGEYNTLQNAQKLSKKLEDFDNSPTVKIGMFTKLILNHQVFHEKLKKFLDQEDPNYNRESTREAADFTVFNRSWHYCGSRWNKEQWPPTTCEIVQVGG